MMSPEKTARAVVTETTGRIFDSGIQRTRRRRIARRVIEAMIEEALDLAEVQSDQRARIYQARNHAFAAIDDYLEGRGAGLSALVEADVREQVQRRFRSYPIESTPFDLRRAGPEHRWVVEAIARSLWEAHAVLTPSQRLIIGDYVRANLGALGATR
jgi:hypothetical protein